MGVCEVTSAARLGPVASLTAAAASECSWGIRGPLLLLIALLLLLFTGSLLLLLLLPQFDASPLLLLVLLLFPRSSLPLLLLFALLLPLYPPSLPLPALLLLEESGNPFKTLSLPRTFCAAIITLVAPDPCL